MLRGVLAAIFACLLLPGIAAAQEKSSNFYGELRGGAVFVDDVEGIDIDTGWLVEGAAGYAHESGFRGELALGYRRAEFDDSIAGFSFDGSIDAITVMANGYYDVDLRQLGAQGGWASRLTPYVGAGLGVAFAELEIDAGALGSAEESETEFAWQVLAGLAYEFSPAWAVTAGWSYIDFDAEAHNVIGGIRYNF